MPVPPPITIVPGRTFFPPGAGPNGHLQFVLSHPVEGNVFVVNATDLAKCPDKSLVLTTADHRALTKPSAIWFAQYQIWSEATVMHHLNGQNRRVDASPALLARLLAGCTEVDIPPYRLEKYLAPALAAVVPVPRVVVPIKPVIAKPAAGTAAAPL